MGSLVAHDDLMAHSDLMIHSSLPAKSTNSKSTHLDYLDNAPFQIDALLPVSPPLKTKAFR